MSDQSDFEEQYRDEVAEAILGNPAILSQDLEVSGDGQMIELNGTVQSYEARLAAEEIAWTYPGVNFVKNNLRVQGENEELVDEEAELTIKDHLAINVDPDFEGVDIAYDAGTVVLEGTVDTAWKRERLLDLITDVPTVIDFTMKVAVVPDGNESDGNIALEIVRNLDENERVDVNTILVTVHEGRVTLSGYVPSFETRSAAYETALRTPGVISVDDRLEVEATF